jgi:hypothetical protein
MENCKHDYQEVYGKEDLKALSDARNAEKKALAENKRLMQTKGRTMTELQKAIKEWVDNDFKGDVLVNDGGLNYTITPMYRARHENPLFKYVKPVKKYVGKSTLVTTSNTLVLRVRPPPRLVKWLTL